MILYALACDAGHRFESWFGSSGSFDTLAEKGLVVCPGCGSTRVGKAIMAPAVARRGGATARPEASEAPPGTSSGDAPPAPARLPSRPAAEAPSGPLDDGDRALRALMRAVRARVLASTQDVGDSFPAEARAMHDGDIPHRDIRGEATLEEARALLEGGIMILPVPGGPGELN